MKVIPKPKEEAATIFIAPEGKKFAFIKSSGNDNYLCGTCNFIICENVDPGQVMNIVFKCPNCGSYNVIFGN